MSTSKYRVGSKRAPRHDTRTLRLAKFVAKSELPTPPPALTYGAKVNPWGMYANDKLGDCTLAGAAHHIMLWTTLDGKPAMPSVRSITSLYRKLSPDDQGCVMLDVLNIWRKSGVSGHKLHAFAALDLQNADHVRLSVMLFGGVYVGLALPNSAQDFVGKVWDVPATGLHGDGKPNSWGGHCVIYVGYNETGPIAATWGALQQLTWAFHNAYCDEAWCLLTQDWARAPKISGIDFVTLQAQLGQLGRVK